MWLKRITDRLANSAARFALRRFDRDEETLHTAFLQLAQHASRPRGLTFLNWEWLPERVLLRDPESNLLTLLVSVNFQFEAEPGGGMEDVEAVSMVRDATAAFHFQDGRWGTAGKVLFNLSPELAASRIEGNWVMVEKR